MGKVKIYVILGILLLAFAGCGEKNESKIRLGVICSYEMAEDSTFIRKLKEQYSEKGYDVSINTLYLRSHYISPSQARIRIKAYLDSRSSKNIDMLLVKDDPALYSLLTSEHPRLKKLQVVFSGLSNPDWELLSNFGDNIRGFWDKPSYTENIKLIEKLFGKVSVELNYDTIILPFRKIADAVSIAADADCDIDSTLFSSGALNNVLMGYDKSHLPRSVVRLVPYNMLRGTDIVKYLHLYGDSSSNVFLIDRADNSTLELCESIDRPAFTTLNTLFCKDKNVIGGYFSTLDTQVTELVDLSISVYNGSCSNIQRYIQSAKQYVFDYKYLKKWNINKDKLPAGSIVIGEPLFEKYPSLLTIIICSVVALFLVLAVYIAYSVRLVRRERNLNENIEQSIEQMLLSLGNSRCVPWIYVDGKFYTDSNTKKLLHLSSTELSSDYLHEHIHPDDFEKLLPENYVLANDIKNAILRFRFRWNPTRSYQWFETHYSAVCDASGKKVISGLAVNIDSHIKRQEEIRRTSELVKKSLSKNSFFNSIMHEIRTPLNAIMGFTDILVSDEAASFDGETRQQMIDEVNVNNERLLAIINNILELSRIDSGKKVFDVQPCDVGKLLDYIYNGNAGWVSSKLEYIKNDFEGKATVSVDRDCFLGVIAQLVTNANKFTPSGHIAVGAYLHDKTHVAFYVEDTGIGIDSDEQKVIFERFYKVNPSTQGTGLGLSIAQAYVEIFGGRIVVRSAVGKGSRFEVVLPCV